MKLSNDLLERVLIRLGFSAGPPLTLDGLRALYAAWCRKVPFDNVRKLIHLHHGEAGALPGDDATEFFEAWLAYGTGGTCWAGNGALHALLSSLGFDAACSMGTMLIAPDVPPNHGTVLVAFDDARYVVDASILHSEPLQLDGASPTGVAHPAWGVQCSVRGPRWSIRWRPLLKPEGIDCLLDGLPVKPESFRKHHEETRLWSPFNYELHARLICGATVVGASTGHRVELDDTGRVLHKHLAGDDRVRLLVDELGMKEAIVQRLPADTPTPPPPGSRTAQALAKA